MREFIVKGILRIIGLVLIVLYVYFRIIKERSVETLYFLVFKENQILINYKLFTICVLFIILCSLILYFLYKRLIKQYINIPKNKVTSMFINLLLLIKNSFLALHEWFTGTIPDSYEKIKRLVLLFYKKYGHNEKQLIFLFYGLPYFIIGSTFLFEVFFEFKLKVFFLALPIYIISLLFTYWIFLIDSIAHNLGLIEQQIDITHRFLPDGKDYFMFSKKVIHDLEDDVFIQYHNEYLLLYPLKGFMINYNALEEYYKLRFTSLLYLCYLFGWLFIVLKNIQNILI